MKEDDLYSLLINFSAKEDESLPKSKNFAENYWSNEVIRRKIEEMLAGNPVEGVYAAVLLWEVDKSRAEEILNSLTNNKTEILIQAPLGFRGVTTNVALAARDFLKIQSVRGTNFYKELTLDN